ncbi:MAG: hypothetical protein F6J93_12675 [Oscillatoria sp. SIO1A7]|nr:hypothetical protein [Oscillatoria sp. SIO1A7]
MHSKVKSSLAKMTSGNKSTRGSDRFGPLPSCGRCGWVEGVWGVGCGNFGELGLTQNIQI